MALPWVLPASLRDKGHAPHQNLQQNQPAPREASGVLRLEAAFIASAIIASEGAFSPGSPSTHQSVSKALSRQTQDKNRTCFAPEWQSWSAGRDPAVFSFKAL